LAGHLGLDNLVLIYDDNRITIDGRTDISFTEDVTKRFEAYGWFVREIEGDGHDLASFDAAVEAARRQTERPTLIKVRTVIGYGSPNKRDSSGVHGSPLGDDEVRLTKKALGWESEETFFVPEKAKELFGSCLERGATAEKRWRASLAEYGKRYPEESETLRRVMDGTLPEKWEESVPTFESGGSVATRVASGKFIEKVMPSIPFIIGGSADLTPSNNTLFSSATIFQKENPGGRYIHFGVREHAMAAIVNGISLSGLTRAYGATFLCFADYMLPAIRVASLSGYPSIFIFTHDSIGLGEDGPTHQPVEHISYLRAMPGLVSFRPADANETVEAWRFALTHRSGPVAISLTRQGLPVLDQSRYGSAKQLERGGYVLLSDDNPELILIATGSEVSLALEAYDLLLKRGVKTRIVSMPSSELFDAQSEAYRDTVLPGSVTKRVAIEAGIRSGWGRYIGDQGRFIGMTGFGASAPAGELFQHFGIDVDSILKTVEEIL
jgi:transketolase